MPFLHSPQSSTMITAAASSSLITSSPHILSLHPIPLSPTLSSSVYSTTLCLHINSSYHSRALLPLPLSKARNRTRVSSSSVATSALAQEVLQPALDSTSDPPAIFDGTTRLYISYSCPYAQRVWIARNCKGLQDEIKLVPIDLQNRPTWYKEKVYPSNKVPSLEHNNEVKGESLDLLKYIDSNFQGPSLFPNDPVKEQFTEELLAYTDSFNKGVTTSFKSDGTSDADAAFDYIETVLSKFDDGPFLLGQFSLVDIAYAPFIERFKPFLLDVKKYDLTNGRPKLTTWIEEMNKIEAYRQTQQDPKEHLETYKKRFVAQL